MLGRSTWAVFLLVGLVTAVPAAGTAQATEARNAIVVRHVFERAWNDAEVDSLELIWATDALFHFRGGSASVGPEGVQAQIERWHRAFEDFGFVVEDLIAAGDRVAVRLTFTGRHTGRFMGVEPTGRQVSVTEMMFFRLLDGRVVEAWEDYDEYGLRQQLQGAP